ncbi:hypothetical protein [Glaciimonas sp. PAMC28666]|uniref:hypothetical protein n=1 Tax=Glaciimonas sp. PAMC28666 TaxID=2807626 RepID=UPI0019640629|nr:hypothetical protein [Glaciimonas sp. PAMC28666]QRX84669.1 hypothetical protein JQN73_11100 [Glaciimonas sp. PAMC28666]
MYRKKTSFGHLAMIPLFTLLSISTAHAQLAPSAQVPSDSASWWQQTKNRLENIADNGAEEVYLSGYAYHGRDTYSAERIRELNEKAWGIGGGRTFRNADGNDESLYFFGIRDSHFKPQLMAGYAYEWVFDVPKSPIEVSAGYTAMLVSRQDYFGGFPFPLPLPIAGIGTKKGKLMFSYVPRLSGNKGNGDVLLIFARFELN